MEELELYHISCKEYPIGKVPPLMGESIYHQNTMKDDRKWINDYLDLHNPKGSPSRKKSFYACDSIANCKALKSTVVKENCLPRIYRVKMLNPAKVPMALVTYLFKLKEGHEFNSRIANEYWIPSFEWKFCEYLSEEMEIIEEIQNNDKSLMGKLIFWGSNSTSLLADDALSAKTLFS